MIRTAYQKVILIILFIYLKFGYQMTADFEMAKCFSEPGLGMKV